MQEQTFTPLEPTKNGKMKLEVLMTGEFVAKLPGDRIQFQHCLSNLIAKRNGCGGRCRLFLSKEHFIYAEEFLKSGYEIFPSTDESADLAVSVVNMNQTEKLDEIIICSDHISSLMLRLLHSEVVRTVITVGDPDVYPKENIDHLIPINLLIDEVDEVLLEKTSKEQTNNDLIFDPNSKGWREELSRCVIQNNGSLPAARAISFLEKDYPGIEKWYQENRNLLSKEIPSELRWIVDAGIPYLYDVNDPRLEIVPAFDAISQLSIGSVVSENKSSIENTPIRVAAADFSDISIRATILADASVWYRKRSQLLGEWTDHSKEIQAGNQEIERIAKEHSVYLWMNRNTYTDDQYTLMEQSYTVMGRIATLMQSMLNAKLQNRSLKEKIAQLMSYAICLVKSTLFNLDISLQSDRVQMDAYELLSAFAKQNKFYLTHLKRDDTLALDSHSELLVQLEQLKEQLQIQIMADDTEKKISYHLQKISKDLPGDIRDWAKVVEGVTTLCEEFHYPATAPYFRTLLIDYFRDIPDVVEITSTFGNVVQQIELYEEEQQLAPFIEEEQAIVEFSPEVTAVRGIYGGSKVVWVGGTPVEHLTQRIQDKLGVELVWAFYDHGDSFSRFSSVLNDPSVKLFLVYIPWCSHKHSEELGQLVRSAGKDFVRLPKGTNPEQIALAICRQMKLI